MMKNSLEIAKQFLGKDVEVIIDRKLGDKHPEFGFVYEVNYGYIEGVKMPDGEDLDVYCLGWDNPRSNVRGAVIAIIHRLNDDDDKLVVAPSVAKISDTEIEKQVFFQERWFEHKILRN